jgi:hypothetical protein
VFFAEQKLQKKTNITAGFDPGPSVFADTKQPTYSVILQDSIAIPIWFHRFEDEHFVNSVLGLHITYEMIK